MKRRAFCAAALWPLALLASRHVSARDDYPSRPIRLIQPYNAGGSSDVVVRPVATKLGAALRQSIIIEYKPEASTIIGTQAVAKAAPDGYTIGLITDSHSMNPLINKSLREWKEPWGHAETGRCSKIRMSSRASALG